MQYTVNYNLLTITLWCICHTAPKADSSPLSWPQQANACGSSCAILLSKWKWHKTPVVPCHPLTNCYFQNYACNAVESEPGLTLRSAVLPSSAPHKPFLLVINMTYSTKEMAFLWLAKKRSQRKLFHDRNQTAQRYAELSQHRGCMKNTVHE